MPGIQRSLWKFGFGLFALHVCSGIAVADNSPRSSVKLGKVPDITLADCKPLSKEETEKIKACIRCLATIDKPDFGLSATMSGEAFLPVATARSISAMLLRDHNLKSSDALKYLVAAGPDALPLLLESLDDKTPTKCAVEHDGVFGAMWFANELSGNPVNALEKKALDLPEAESRAGRAPPRRDFGGESVKKYTVKVGDVCFVAIGQIVGRHYNAVRYQPTACIVINSPTHDAMICRQLRQLWKSKSPRQTLLDSLLTDYATEGVFNGKTLDGWDDGSEFQIQAAMRLLYYFPHESASMIAERLHGFDLRATDDFIHREVANGCRVPEFIKTVSWCKEPAIRREIKSIFSKATDVGILLAAMSGIDDADRPLIRDRLGSMLAEVRVDEGGGSDSGYRLMTAIADRLGKDGTPMFDKYLNHRSAQRGYIAAMALANGSGEWRTAILRRLLVDTRPIGHYYEVDPDNQDVRLEKRVCDIAAESLNLLRPDLKFKMEGPYKELDAQIERMEKAYDKTKNEP